MGEKKLRVIVIIVKNGIGDPSSNPVDISIHANALATKDVNPSIIVTVSLSIIMIDL